MSLLMNALVNLDQFAKKSICGGQNPVVCSNHKSIGYNSY